MNIVLIPCWRRAEFLQLCIEHIYEANRAKDQFYIFLIDRDFHRDVKLVAEQFKLDKHIRFTPFHNFRGNSYNVLNGYNLALNEADKYKPDLVYLIEEDIYVGKDFFDFHKKVQEQYDNFFVSGVMNQNYNKDGFDPSSVYYYSMFQSLGLSWKIDKLKYLMGMVKPGYYGNMTKHLSMMFPNSKFGTKWCEQDGLINRVMEAYSLKGLYPIVPRAYHAGFIGYNRPATSIQGGLKDRIDCLKNMSIEEMNNRAKIYKDIKPCSLDDYGVKDFNLVD